MQDKRQCSPTALFYQSTSPTWFEIDASCKILVNMDSYVSVPGIPCTGSVQQVEPLGLLFQGCGSNGSILVPVVPRSD
jgi:hypothetical protein